MVGLIGHLFACLVLVCLYFWVIRFSLSGGFASEVSYFFVNIFSHLILDSHAKLA